MFSECYNLTSVPLFNYTNVTTAAYAFADCYNLTTVEGEGIYTPYGLNGTGHTTCMFMNDYRLETINFDIDLGSMQWAQQIFMNCYNLKHSPVINFGNNLEHVDEMFSGCSALEDLNLSTFTNYNTCEGTDTFLNGIPNNCKIFVADQNQKDWLLNLYPNFTNIQIIV